ncbi:MAG: RagB/SusD family nutrient uptake outer membrane protein [Flectobacillus sp.]|nr:RagB/SusD family nutrient uptake outer membrane protein [Flectobacillus sp.]
MKISMYEKKIIWGVLMVSLLAASCMSNLDKTPIVTSTTAYDNPVAYKQAAEKLYSGIAVAPGDKSYSDSSIYEGFSSYLRQYWQLQELPTDEAVIGWSNADLQDLHRMAWSSNNALIKGFYNQIFYQIRACNEFIRESSDDILIVRGITGTSFIETKQFRTEARFLRALSYWHALDLFGGNVHFITENDTNGSTSLKQTNASDLFAYIESELKAIDADLVDARKNGYGRADKAAAWMLLAKLYLNAEVAGQGNHYADAAAYSKKVIDAGYTLEAEYSNLFKADNNLSKEIIFSVNFDGVHTKSWGGMTYLVHAQIGGSMKATDLGVTGAWAGLRTTKNLVNLFADATGKIDSRAMFHSDGQKLEIEDITQFSSGYAVKKYSNVSSIGKAGSDQTHPDTDYPMFRLGDAYLIYAEAAARGAGDRALALQYVNALRTRSYGSTAGNVAASALTTNFILDERARELYWEGTRRTDLIRFGKYTSSAYVWPWKGGIKEGTPRHDHLKMYPIPATELTANSYLKQNVGY